VDYVEKRYHDMIPHLSTAKSPQQMQGALTKTYWAEQMKLKPEEIFNVSIMPCTAKSWEARRDANMYAGSGDPKGVADVDMVITTREFADLIRQFGINFARLPNSTPDLLLGLYSGAGTIFGATGGVMEAAVRTAYALVEGHEMRRIDYTPVRGLDAVKESSLTLGGKEVRIAVVHQLGNVDAVVKRVRKALEAGQEAPWHFIEVMACRGGCLGGGGQPYFVTDDIRKKRAEALYQDDEQREIRVSHKNPMVQELYAKYLDSPGSEKAHRILHTKYTVRELYTNWQPK
jgi:NADH-quinone oxidoreductase subunit G